jgi:cob(I)alamin adenosyltransferase
MPEKFKGFIQVYTGAGKGKTTAALGLALRAAGRGLRTYFGQFLKGRTAGEALAAAKLAPLLVIEAFGHKGFVVVTDADGPADQDVALAENGLATCRKAMLSGNYDIIVLDEVCVAVDLKVLPEAKVLEFLDAKPAGVEVVLTGRGATSALLERANLVTEMAERKRYFPKGIRARDGIEK